MRVGRGSGIQDMFLETSCSDRLDVGLAVGGEKLGLTLGSWTEQLRGWMVVLSNNMGTTSVKGTHFKKKIDSFI